MTIVPTHTELTTQEAANILNVSRSYLIKLLEEGTIPFTSTGSHRRVRYQDLMKYKAVRDRRSREALEELAKQSQKLDMGY
ncbi:excisionase family DNA-binding protein [Methylohalobius crimeensis]|uniref:excisionase family DNA-binding protein n=1 Tax=Methylohalobius crimeensis TaxID=244365 RepID=UPI00041E723A|nr:excisionase family DNA-binding protein [Methylohalobius crimeensis]